jgi:hypothetical protein
MCLKIKIIKMMKAKVLIIGMFIMAGAGFGGFAQETNTKKVSGGVGYFMIGYSGFSVSDINTQFQISGYPELQKGTISLGGGGHFVYRNWIIGGEGHGLPGGKVSNDRYDLSISGGYGFFNTGYIVYHTKTLNLYPLVGVGGGGSSVVITEKANEPSGFEEVLCNSARQSTITNGGFMMNFSIGADFFVLADKTENATGGWLIGIKAGYVVQLNNNQWYFNGRSLQESPQGCISGPYVRLTIGGGGLVNQ